MQTKFIHNRKNKLNAQGTALVQIQFYGDRTNRPLKSTEVYISPDHWDDKKQRVRKTHPRHKTLNDQLDLSLNQWEQFLLKMKYDLGFVDWDKFKLINNPSEVDQSCFIDFYKNVVMEISNVGLEKETKKSYAATLKKLEDYQSGRKLPYPSVNVDFCERFNHWMVKLNLGQNTRHKHFKNIKKAFSEAVKRNYIKEQNSPFNSFKISTTETQKKAISLEDLKCIERLDVSYNPSLQKAKDMFLFSTYTCLRFSDLAELSFHHFEDKDGKLHLRKVQQKTKRAISYCLSDLFPNEDGAGKAEAIIRRHFALHQKAIDAPAGTIRFFFDNNQYYNRLLKDIARLAEIKSNLSSHAARHTGVTLLLNEVGLPIQDVQKIAGHTKIQTTMIYFHHTEKDVNKALSTANWNIH